MGDIFERKQGETDFAYKYRLITGKKNQLEPYCSLEWEDIKEMIDSNEHRDTLRKRGDAWKELLDHAEEINLKDSDNEVLLEIKKERCKLNDIRSLVNKQIRQLSKIEDFTEIIINDCKNINGFSFMDNDKIELFDNGTDSILLLSDIHYDGRQEIIDDFNKVIDYTINKCKFHKINRLIVFLGGDLINNELRTTTRIENREGISKQITGVASLISEGLAKLSKSIPYICVANVVGNHSRSIVEYKDSMSTDNYLCLIKELINLRLKDIHNITFLDNVKDDDRFCVVDIHGKTYCLCHGDGLRNIEKSAIPTIEGFLGIKIDILCLGHFHNIKNYTFYDSKVVVNGALCNTFDYSKKSLLSTPCYQRLLMLDNNGDIECTYDIKL